MSEDHHNPDGSPPSFVPAEERAKYWERRARFNEENLNLQISVAVKAERARSADLVTLLKDVLPAVITFESQFSFRFPLATWTLSDRIQKAISGDSHD